MLVGYALLPLIVATLLFFGLRWKSYELAFLVLLLTICEVSLIPVFHQTTTQLAFTLQEGLLLALRESIVWLPALFFVYVQYATHTCTLIIQLLARLVPSRELLLLLLVFGIGPCLASWEGPIAGMILLLPLLTCLHQNRTNAIALGLLSLVGTAGGTSTLTNLAPPGMYDQTLLLLAPVCIGASLFVIWLSRRTDAPDGHWGTALVIAGLTIVTAWLFHQVLSPAAVNMGTGTVVIGLLFLRGRMLARKPTPRAALLTREQIMRALLPYAVLCSGFCVSTLLLFSWPATIAPTSSLLSFLPRCSAGLGLGLGALLLLRFAPLSRMHLRRIALIAGRQALPSVATLGCFWCTILLMDRSGMLLVLTRSLEQGHLNASWVAALMGAVEGWMLQAPQSLVIPVVSTPSASWLLATQAVVALLTASVAPVALLLAKAATGVTELEMHLLSRVGRFLLWAVSSITLMGTCFVTTGWLHIGALGALGLLLLLPLLAFKNRVRSHLLQCLLLTQKNVSTPQTLPSVLRSWLAFGALVLVNVLYASSSLVSLGPLVRLDPTIFLCLQMLLLVPPGLLLLRSAHVPLTRVLLWRGLQLGACLAAGLLCVALSLKETGILETTIFSCLNGVIAMLIARWLFGQRLSLWNWGAGCCLLAGAFLVWLVAPLHWQSNVTAFVAGLLLTCDGFQVEALLSDYGPGQAATIRTILGVQCLAMASLTTIIALCFGHWQTLHLFVPSDLLILCYLSAGTILLPCVLMLWAQRTLSAVTVACGSVIEPCVSLGASMLLSGQHVPPLALLGSGVVLVGIVSQLMGSTTSIPSKLE